MRNIYRVFRSKLNFSQIENFKNYYRYSIYTYFQDSVVIRSLVNNVLSTKNYSLAKMHLDFNKA